MSPSANPVSVILTTLAAGTDAAALARTLVDERLAACVNILPAMTSVYRWQGRIEQESEHQLLVKTASSRVAALEHRLRELHPYDIPEFVVLEPRHLGSTYLAWVLDAVGGPG